MSSRELNAKVNNQINRYLRTSEDVVRAWPKGVKLTTKCLRSLYAEIAYKVYAPATMAKAPYFAQILGHSSEDLGTALSYMDYVLDVSDENEAREQMQALVDNINDQDAEFGNPYEAPAELEEEQAAPAPKSTGKDDGEVIDENALTRMLRADEIAGAGLDVYERGNQINPRLKSLPNVILLPHMASATVEGRLEMGEKVLLNIKTFDDGHRPPDLVVPGML